MRERIQKLLAARGVGSRRRIESWIEAGRITVNGKPAAKGQAVIAADDIRLDGRRLRLDREPRTGHQGVVYHRPAQEDLRPGPDGARSSLERLPKASGRRWIPVSPLPPRDGGLELFVTDGRLAAALTRHGAEIPSEYGVRVRGKFDASAIGSALATVARELGIRGDISEVAPMPGEGSNRWLSVRTVGMRTGELRQLLASCGLEPNRILRTRYGPISMERALARGRSRKLTDAELAALGESARLRPAGSRSMPR